MPNVEVVRFSDAELELRAIADTAALAPGMNVRFLREVRTRVSVAEALGELNRFLQGVADQLRDVPTPRARAFRAMLAGRPGGDEAMLLGRLGLEPSDGATVQAILADPRRDQLAAIIEASAATTLERRVEEARHVVGQLPAPPPQDANWAQLERAAGRPSRNRLPPQVCLIDLPASEAAPALSPCGERWRQITVLPAREAARTHQTEHAHEPRVASRCMGGDRHQRDYGRWARRPTRSRTCSSRRSTRRCSTLASFLYQVGFVQLGYRF